MNFHLPDLIIILYLVFSSTYISAHANLRSCHFQCFFILLICHSNRDPTGISKLKYHFTTIAIIICIGCNCTISVDLKHFGIGKVQNIPSSIFFVSIFLDIQCIFSYRRRMQPYKEISYFIFSCILSQRLAYACSHCLLISSSDWV